MRIIGVTITAIIDKTVNVRNIKAREALAKLFAILGVGGFGIVNRDKFNFEIFSTDNIDVRGFDYDTR